MSMIHEITANAPRNKRSQRKGRGESSGRGKTCGRGTKGSGAHGGDVHWIPGREGGQTPLYRRLLKLRGEGKGAMPLGPTRKFYAIVNLSQLGRFEAGTAARIDEGHVRFKNLKMITFDEREQPDFKIDMADAILNLETRVIDSKARTKIKRADFEIAGDVMSFNTVTKFGTLSGNVHMTLFNQKEIAGSAPKP